MASNSYVADYAKNARSKCKATSCKEQIAAKELRLGKSHPSGFHDGDETNYYHPKCLIDSFKRVKAGTKIIETTGDIEGFGDLTKADQQLITNLLAGKGGSEEKTKTPTKASPKRKAEKEVAEEKPVTKKAKAAPKEKAKAAKKGGDDFSTWVIAISGTLSRKRDEVVEEIESAGATYSKTVTKKVTHLVVADPNANTAKIVKAKEEGVNILGENDLPF